MSWKRSEGGNFHHFNRDVGAAEAVNEARRLDQRQLLHDVVLHGRRGGGGQRDDRRRPQAGHVLAQAAVIGPEIVPPLRNAVRLIHHDQRNLPLGEHLRKARHAQALRRNEQELQFAGQVVAASLPRIHPAAPGMNALHSKTPSLELGHLVFHQGDQGTDDQRRPAARNGRQLIAQRLARPGGHDQQHVAPFDHRPANRFLIGEESVETEGAAQKRAQVNGGSGRLNGGHNDIALAG